MYFAYDDKPKNSVPTQQCQDLLIALEFAF